MKDEQAFSVAVVSQKPYRWFLPVVALILVLSLAAGLGFWLGSRYSHRVIEQPSAEYEQLLDRYEKKRAEVAFLEQRVANLALATEVDRKANVEVRARVVELKNQLAQMKRDNAFYQSIMVPSASVRGVVIDAPSFERIKDKPNHYRYSVTLKQVVAKHQQVSGYLTFDVMGEHSGEQQTLSLHEISSTVENKKMKLRFKYFQRVQGELIFPEGFVPHSIHLNAVIQRPSKLNVVKKFGWLTPS